MNESLIALILILSVVIIYILSIFIWAVFVYVTEKPLSHFKTIGDVVDAMSCISFIFIPIINTLAIVIFIVPYILYYVFIKYISSFFNKYWERFKNIKIN
jgi:hypothetical protein